MRRPVAGCRPASYHCGTPTDPNRVSHSVARHLRIAIESYDRTIREFIPDYDEMLDRAARAVVAAAARGVALDLGAGTGALSERVLELAEQVTVELVDVDPEMLKQARERLKRFGSRARYRVASFHDRLPQADAVMASLALHHVPGLDEKTSLYRQIARGLRPGGVLVNADVTMPDEPAERAARYERWAAHLMRSGMDRAAAFRHFEDWSGEDHYFSLEGELAAMAAAGFEPEAIWVSLPAAVLVGVAPLAGPAGPSA